jgi:hypothetical protein
MQITFRRALLALAASFGSITFGSSASAELLTGLTTTNQLVSFDSATPGTINTTVGITGLQAGETLLGIDFRPANGGLYALGSTSRLYSINPLTGVATQVGSAGSFTLSGTSFGADFNPTVDRLRVTSNTGQNLRLNPNDGTLSATDTPLAYAAGDANAGTTPRVVGSAYTNNFAGAVSTTLYAIDSNLDVLATQNPPNAGVLNTVGALGFNTSDLVGFDISGSGIAYALLTAPAANSSQLFTINLSTGAATLIGTVGGGVTLNGLAAPIGSVPEPGTWLMFLIGFGLIGVSIGRNRVPAASEPARA